MKWYVVHLLFAQSPKENKQSVKCESSEVLFQAKSASDAYDRGLEWGKNYSEDEGIFHFFGIEHVHEIGDDISDGTEIGGEFFNSEDIWERRDEIIPPKNQIKAIVWEENPDTPIGELMTEKQKQDIKEIFGED